MILTTYDKDLYEKTLKEDAKEEGREEGLTKGRAETRAELNQLTICLLNAKRYNDLEHAAKDIEYQKKLLKESKIQCISPISVTGSFCPENPSPSPL